MEEVHRTRYGERSHSFHILSRYTTFPESSCAHQCGGSPNSLQTGHVMAAELVMVDYIIGYW